VNIASDVVIGQYSLVGVEDGSNTTGQIARGCSIGSFCHITQSVTLGPDVYVDNYVRIGDETTVGERTRLLFNATIDKRARIGHDCIISGNVVNDVEIGDFVSYQGNIAHAHRNPLIPWDDYWESSPRILDQSVVGVDALLIGPVSIGPRSYIGAGEVVRHDVPPDSVLFKGEISPLSKWRGLIQVRDRERMRLVQD